MLSMLFHTEGNHQEIYGSVPKKLQQPRHSKIKFEEKVNSSQK